MSAIPTLAIIPDGTALIRCTVLLGFLWLAAWLSVRSRSEFRPSSFFALFFARCFLLFHFKVSNALFQCRKFFLLRRIQFLERRLKVADPNFNVGHHPTVTTDAWCGLHKSNNAQPNLLGFWSAIKIRLKSAYRAQPKVRVEVESRSWMSKHGSMIRALWAVRIALEGHPIPLPKDARIGHEGTLWDWC